MVYTIYLHKNKINGKVYVGMTRKRPEERWKNGHGYKTCTYFYHAIEKYGWDNFEHFILEQKEMTIEEASLLEKIYIEKYDSCNPKKGYNIKEGGGHDISPNASPAGVKWMREHPEFGLAKAQEML